MWRGYILISNLPPGWTKSERDCAWDAMRRIGRQQSEQPSHINHTRLSLDGSALLVEAEFDESEIAQSAVVAMIAAALGVQPSEVEAKMAYQVLAPGGTWEESNQAAREYLAANSAAWESPLAATSPDGTQGEIAGNPVVRQQMAPEKALASPSKKTRRRKKEEK